jgi:glutamate-1-semialdehyde 2,1-aminomutase
MRATLSSTLRQVDFDHMIPLASRWTQGVRFAYEDAGLSWHVQQLGCRAEYWFGLPPKNGAEAAAQVNHRLEAFLHLYCLNRGVLLTPFHNMALMAPAHTVDDVDRHTTVFAEAVSLLVPAS